MLAEKGVDVVNVIGGVEAWQNAGYELDGKGRVLPMMRQVLIAAGALILIGFFLGMFVHEAWYWLVGAVGAGLFFAGSTGVCSMTYVLKLMPWNKT